MLSTPDKRLAVQAYEQVLELIVSRRLAPDTVIQERKLSEHLNMSRTPLRDALLMLEGEGLLIRNEGRGVRVRSMDIVDFVENLAVRSLLEPEAVRLAAGQIEDHKLADLERAVAAILERKMSGMPTERESVRAVDEELHATIMLAAGNKQMASIIRSLRQQTRIFDVRNLPQRLEDTCREHLDIIGALRQKRRDDAVDAMRRHLMNVRRSIIEYLAGV